MNFALEYAIIAQQIALNNKMYENNHIAKQSHNKTHNTLLNNLTNLVGQDMISHSDVK